MAKRFDDKKNVWGIMRLYEPNVANCGISVSLDIHSMSAGFENTIARQFLPHLAYVLVRRRGVAAYLGGKLTGGFP